MAREKDKKKLRSGFTTGACSAAATKAALVALNEKCCPEAVEISFPGGKRHTFFVYRCNIAPTSATVSIIKDAGDDPDVTNGAEICAAVQLGHNPEIQPPHCVFLGNIQLCRGKGVGYATKPGLAVQPGEPAINPGPRKMIQTAAAEVYNDRQKIQITISVTDGEELATQTLNQRLGILGGISILGSTGIVRPVSADAWKATILASMTVAQKAGLHEIVLSTGRTSEKGAQQRLNIPEESYAMMGDYLKFSLQAAATKGFTTIHISGMWAKITKAALRIPQTHVRNGALEMIDAANLLEKLGATGDLLEKIKECNTAREMYAHLFSAGRQDIIEAVCLKAKEYAQDVSGVEIRLYLVGTGGELLVTV